MTCTQSRPAASRSASEKAKRADPRACPSPFVSQTAYFFAGALCVVPFSTEW
jgi:hypothetical protein